MAANTVCVYLAQGYRHHSLYPVEALLYQRLFLLLPTYSGADAIQTRIDLDLGDHVNHASRRGRNWRPSLPDRTFHQ